MPLQKKSQMEAVCDSKGPKCPRQVRLDGSLADLELARDVLVARPAADEISHQPLLWGQRFQRAGLCRLGVASTPPGKRRKLRDQNGNQPPLDPNLTVLDRLQGP